MQSDAVRIYFLAALMMAATALVFLIVRPLFAPLLLAAVFATLFQPLYRRVHAAMPKYPSIASLLTVALVSIVVGLVLAFLINHLVAEAESLYGSISTPGDILNSVPEPIRALLDTYAPAGFHSTDLTAYIQSALGWFIANIGGLFSGAARIALGMLVFVIALYYFLRDGKEIARFVVATSPLRDRDDEEIIQHLERATNSVLRGSLMIALIQGALSTIGYTIFGIPNPLIWGSLTALAALVPGLGTSIVIGPAILYLYFQGETGHALGLLIWGMFAVGLIDNFVGPRLMGRGIRMHPLLMLVSVLGGVSFFGPVGFVAGPLALAFFVTILQLATERARQ